MNQPPSLDSAEQKIARVLRVAKAARSQALHWASFYRAVLGPKGIVPRMFPNRQALEEFQQSDAFREIQRMLTDLRRRRPASLDPDEPTAMITVRVPASLHYALRAEAFDRRTTLNKLCISKLLQWIDEEMVPQEASDPPAEKEEDEDKDQVADQPAVEFEPRVRRRAQRTRRRSA